MEMKYIPALRGNEMNEGTVQEQTSLHPQKLGAGKIGLQNDPLLIEGEISTGAKS